MLNTSDEGTPAPGAMLRNLKGIGFIRRRPVVRGGVPRLFQPTAGHRLCRIGADALAERIRRGTNPVRLGNASARSILTLWFHQRLQLNGGRVRKVLIIALARDSC